MQARLNELDGEFEVSQKLFSSLLLNPEPPCPEGLMAPDGQVDNKRFAVYRNNVVVGLTGALADIFPAIVRLLGEEAFKSLARLYVAQEPPTSPLMFEYGRGFAAFIEAFEPLAKYPYLADVARIERLWLDCYHGPDIEPLAPEALGAFAPEQLGQIKFDSHPAAKIVASEYAAVSIFSANRQNLPMDGIDPKFAEYGLVSRPLYDVDVRQIPHAAFEFFKALFDGQTLGDAASIAGEVDEGFDISLAISTMLEAGLFTHCYLDQPEG